MKDAKYKNRIYTLTSLVCVLALLFCSGAVPVSADTTDELYTQRYSDALAVPHKSTLTFSHKESALPVRQSLTVRAEAMTIVSICFSYAKDSKTNARSAITASVYTDKSELLCEKSASYTGITHLQFLVPYSGVFHIIFTSRSYSTGEFTAEADIGVTKKYETNSIPSLPYSRSLTPSTHKTNNVSKIYSNPIYNNSSFKLSIFTIEHKAGSILTYKLSTPSDSGIHAVLYTREGEYFTPHIGRSGNGYSAGDALELAYSGTAYLFVYSTGSFSISADTLEHLEYKVSPLTLPHTGSLDLSDASPMYDGDAIGRIIDEFPFSRIENRSVKFFSLPSGGCSVVTMLCDRKEHKYMSLVSGELGLSPGSVYPLGQYSSYCSEIHPSTLCYESVISDSSEVYLCYSGTSAQAYAELYASELYTLPSPIGSRYSPGSEMPKIQPASVYSDSDVYGRIGVDTEQTEIGISGYVFLSESGERLYVSGGDDAAVPRDRGKYRLYATFRSAYSGSTEAQVRYFTVYISDVEIERPVPIPVIDEILDYIEKDPPKAIASITLTGAIALILAYCAFQAARRFLPRKKKEGKEDARNIQVKGREGAREDTREHEDQSPK